MSDVWKTAANETDVLGIFRDPGGKNRLWLHPTWFWLRYSAVAKFGGRLSFSREQLLARLGEEEGQRGELAVGVLQEARSRRATNEPRIPCKHRRKADPRRWAQP